MLRVSCAVKHSRWHYKNVLFTVVSFPGSAAIRDSVAHECLEVEGRLQQLLQVRQARGKARPSSIPPFLVPSIVSVVPVHVRS